MKYKIISLLAVLVFVACTSVSASEGNSDQGMAMHHMHMMTNQAIESDQSMTMHHMHMLINHAIQMAATGSNLIMLGQMGMAEGVDKLSIHHGRMMIKHAESLMQKIMEGRPMESMHKKGVTPKASEQMAYTHELFKLASSYIHTLTQMFPAECDH